MNLLNNQKLLDKYPLRIPKEYLTKIEVSSALKLQFLPDERELDSTGSDDPIGDKVHFKAPQLIHRYENRVLFTPTSVCPINCRYCFRKNELYESDELFDADFKKTLSYLTEHSEVNEIIFTGGDPLMLSDKKIKYYLEAFSKIPHIKFIRFHSRVPVITPKRISNELIEILNSFFEFKTQIVIHTNHVDELGSEEELAINKLTDARIELLSQSVLLKGVNNNVEALYKLILKLVEFNIRPYYLHHPDKVKGGMHFYLSITEGRRIYAKLKSKLSGWMLPRYIIDIDGGQGKVDAFNPETFEYSGTLINKDSQLIIHSEL